MGSRYCPGARKKEPARFNLKVFGKGCTLECDMDASKSVIVFRQAGYLLPLGEGVVGVYEFKDYRSAEITKFQLGNKEICPPSISGLREIPFDARDAL